MRPRRGTQRNVRRKPYIDSLECGRECDTRINGRDLLVGEAQDPIVLEDFVDPGAFWLMASLLRNLAHDPRNRIRDRRIRVRLLAALEADPPAEFEEWGVDLWCPECHARINSSSIVSRNESARI